MSENKRKGDARDKQRKRFRHDGTRIQSMNISGPSVWVTCVRGREKQAVGELYDLFEQVSAEMWPESDSPSDTGLGRRKDADEDNDEDDADEDEDEDIEKQIAKEMSSMKRPRKEQRFGSCQTNTDCFVIISCKAPVDPVQLVVKHVDNIISSGTTQTRFVQRLTPVSDTCTTNIPEMKALCTRLLEPFLKAEDGKTFSYKLELRMRNHNTLVRTQIIEELARCVPQEHKVNLENPDVFILIEIFKSVCGMGIVRDYYRLQKFNVMEIAKTEEPGFKQGEGRVGQKETSTSAKESTAE